MTVWTPIFSSILSTFFIFATGTIAVSNPNAAASMGVRGIPALFIFKDGEVVSNRAGAAPKAALQSWIDDSI